MFSNHRHPSCFRPNGSFHKPRQDQLLRLFTLAAGILLIAVFVPICAIGGAPETISGTCRIACTDGGRRAGGSMPSATFNVVMPDGKTYVGTCIDPGRVAPLDGSYPFEGHWNGSSYDITVKSSYTAYDKSQIHPWMIPYLIENAFPTTTQRIGRFKYRPYVDVMFQKKSSDSGISNGNPEYSLGGAEFVIRRQSDNSVVATFTTDANGRAVVSLPAAENLYLEETREPSGFQKLNRTISFNPSDGTVEIPESPHRVRLRIQKRDSSTGGAPQRGASLGGAEYLIVDAAGKEQVAVTDSDGIAEIDGIPLGAIKVTEIKPPEGYKIDPTVHEYHVGAEQVGEDLSFLLNPEGDFTEDVVAFDITLSKFLGDDATWENDDGHPAPAEGIAFDIISNTTGSVVGSIKTGRDGFASTKGLWFGDGERAEGVTGALPYDSSGYTIRENPDTVPEGYDTVGEWAITPNQMIDGTTLHYILDNHEISTQLKIVKRDETTGSVIPLAGFTFQLIDSTGTPVMMSDVYPNERQISSFTTDDTGMVTLPERISPGSYTIREVSCPAPYLIAQDTPLTISGDAETAAPLAIIDVADDQAMGRATIVKHCSERDEGAVDATDCRGALEGAEFDVVAEEDIVSPDGYVRAKKGDVVDHVVTDEEGIATTRELFLGEGEATYSFIETKAPAGHVRDSTPHEFTLSYKDPSTPLVTIRMEIENQPTEIIIDKDVAGTTTPLPGASFRIWNHEDEARISDAERGGSIVLRAPEARRASLSFESGRASIQTELPPDYTLHLEGSGSKLELDGGGARDITPGDYSISITDSNGENLSPEEEQTITIESGFAYSISYSSGIAGFGEGASVHSTAFDRKPIDMVFDELQEVFIATNVGAGTYAVLIDDEEVGTVDVDSDSTSYLICDKGGVGRVSHILKPEKSHLEVKSDEDGLVRIHHIVPGDYLIEESAAPAGYLVDESTRPFSVAPDGTIQSEATHTIRVENDFTKIDLSKRDISDEEEVPGAQLQILNMKDEVVEEWTSTALPHRIDALPPGEYKLVEMMTPRGYDQAAAVTFLVEPTGVVQHVAIYDEPITISGEVDKRQEIAEPTNPLVKPDLTAPEGGSNNAMARESDDGSFSYSVDFRNISSTWVDEFTLTDDLLSVSSGLATLKGITTPVAAHDYDGLLNVWYKTNLTADDYLDPSKANATLSDGHGNPWLDHESVRESLGDDGRALDYRGWRLWATGVDATQPSDLDIEELELSDGEKVTSVRLEYGRVEEGFSSRSADWNRAELKNIHDDLNRIPSEHENDPLGSTTTEFNVDGTWKHAEELELEGIKVSKTTEETWVASGVGTSNDANGSVPLFRVLTEEEYRQAPILRSPLLIHMNVTDSYQNGSILENDARIDLFRNGGNDGEEGRLEDHDADHVEQHPRPLEVEPFAQTGIDTRSLFVGIASLLLALTAMAITIRIHR